MSEKEFSPSSSTEHISTVPKEVKLIEANIADAQNHLEAAQAKVDALNFKSTATDHIYAKDELKQANTTYGPELESLQETWTKHGGARIEAARAAVDSLNFKSDAIDRIRAKKELQAAEDAWVESYHNSEAESTGEETEPEEVNNEEVTEGNYNSMDLKELVDAMVLAKLTDNTTESMSIQAAISAKLDAGAAKNGWTSEQREAYADNIRNNIAQRTKLPGESTAETKADDETKSSADSPVGTIGNDGLPEVPDPVDEAGEVKVLRDSSKLAEVPDPEEKSSEENDEAAAEKQSIWKRMSRRAHGLFDKANVTLGHGLVSIGSRFSQPRYLKGETNEQYEKRIKRNTVLLLIGGAALAVYGIHELLEGVDGSAVHHAISGHTPGVGPHTPSTGVDSLPPHSGDAGAGGNTMPTHSGIETAAPTLSTPEASSYANSDPWQWAVDAFGKPNATPELHHLTDIAQAHGYHVEWLPAQGGGQYIKIDGDSKTVDVINILRQYAN